MNNYYVDLHIHIGYTEQGAPVKISAAKDLTFYNIAREASERKGIEVIGIIDCQSPAVQQEIQHYLDKREMAELAGGGIRYGNTTVLLGCEIEVRDSGMGAAHLLIYLPNLSDMQDFTKFISAHMKNVNLSSQRVYVSARTLQDEAIARGGFVIPAHAFTPHKGLYGSSTDRMENLLDPDRVTAVELGLSADSEMAGHISELDRYSFVSNSDAHSLAKIGREYNLMALSEPTFNEVYQALLGNDGRHVAANFGLNPKLGKYHRTYCEQCESILDEEMTATNRCLYCGSTKIVRGVLDRILEIADRDKPFVPANRPPYQYQVPLEFIPGLGKRKMAALLDRFGTEMNIIHHAKEEQIAEVVGSTVAELIVQARAGNLTLSVGGGGRYGKVSL